MHSTDVACSYALPSGVAKSCTSFGWGNGRNVTSAEWQVTLCDRIWHASSRSGEAGLLTKGEPLYRVYFTLLLQGTILAPSGEYDESICAGAMIPPLATITVATCHLIINGHL